MQAFVVYGASLNLKTQCCTYIGHYCRKLLFEWKQL